MTENNKRFRVFKYPDCKEYGVSDDIAEYTLARFDNHFEAEGLCELLNELHEEKEWLEMNNKDLVSFIKSKGYTLKDFLKYVGQFRSVGVNKEDWND